MILKVLPSLPSSTDINPVNLFSMRPLIKKNQQHPHTLQVVRLSILLTQHQMQVGLEVMVLSSCGVRVANSLKRN